MSLKLAARVCRGPKWTRSGPPRNPLESADKINFADSAAGPPESAKFVLSIDSSGGRSSRRIRDRQF